SNANRRVRRLSSSFVMGRATSAPPRTISNLRTIRNPQSEICNRQMLQPLRGPQGLLNHSPLLNRCDEPEQASAVRTRRRFVSRISDFRLRSHLQREPSCAPIELIGLPPQVPARFRTCEQSAIRSPRSAIVRSRFYGVGSHGEVVASV